MRQNPRSAGPRRGGPCVRPIGLRTAPRPAVSHYECCHSERSARQGAQSKNLAPINHRFANKKAPSTGAFSCIASCFGGKPKTRGFGAARSEWPAPSVRHAFYQRFQAGDAPKRQNPLRNGWQRAENPANPQVAACFRYLFERSRQNPWVSARRPADAGAPGLVDRETRT